jgi:hypothetical protein
MSRYQKVGEKHSIKIANRSFEDVEKWKYLEKLTDQNFVHEKVKAEVPKMWGVPPGGRLLSSVGAGWLSEGI